MSEPFCKWWIWIVAFMIVGIGIITFEILDPLPATEEQCKTLDGTYEHIHKWCDCEKVWVGGELNKSSTECHTKVKQEQP